MEVLKTETESLTDRQKESLWHGMKGMASVENIGGNLLRISYRSKDPEEAKLLASNLVDVFIKIL